MLWAKMREKNTVLKRIKYISLGIGLGLCIGVAVGTIMEQKKNDRDKETKK